jgi:hypothetical protein
MKVDAKNQVRKILEVLNRHGELISDALEGSIELPDRGKSDGLDALVGINALMPVEEGLYQLNPRIRSFLSEQLAQYSAFQTLTRISEQIHGAKTKWREIVHIKESGDLRDMAALEESLGYTVNEIIHFTAQNLLLLNTQISTEYGNVETLRAKLRQNAFYSDGVKNLLAELQQLDAFTAEIDKEALSKGLSFVRQMVNTRIRSKLHDWYTKLNDVQATISKRLFVARKLEEELRQLSQAVLWLTRNPTKNGIEVEPTAQVSPALLRTACIRVKPQVDVSDIGLHNLEAMARIASRIGPPPDPWAPPKETPPQFVLSTQMEEINTPRSPEDALIDDLILALEHSDSPSFSVLDWQPERRQALEIDSESWLLYVASQLNLHGIPTNFQMCPRNNSDLNDVFKDLIAGKPKRARGSAIVEEFEGTR